MGAFIADFSSECCVSVCLYLCVLKGGRVANIAAGNPCGEGAVFVFIFFALFAQQL